MAPMYYRGANAAILVYDITNPESFLDIQNWLNELRQNMTSDLIIQIVGSKADLSAQRAVNLDEAYQKIIEWTRFTSITNTSSANRTNSDQQQQQSSSTTISGGVGHNNPNNSGFQFNLIHDEDESFLSALGNPPNHLHHHHHHHHPPYHAYHHHHHHHHHSSNNNSNNLDDLSSAGTSSSNTTNNINSPAPVPTNSNGHNFLLGVANSNLHGFDSNPVVNHQLGSSQTFLSPLSTHSNHSRRWNNVGVTEVSAKDDFGIEELFLILTRRLVLRKVEIDEIRTKRSRDSILIDGDRFGKSRSSSDAHHRAGGDPYFGLGSAGAVGSGLGRGWCC